MESFVEFLSRDELLAAVQAPLVRLVAEGEQVPVERLAAAAELPVERVEAWLRAQPGTDWDASGRLLGFGLTQRPTAHRFWVEGRQLYTFCAADTLLFPPILGKPAVAESACPATETTIRVEVTPTAVRSVQPATAVVTQAPLRGDPAITADIRGKTCDHGLFYATAEATASWRREHPGGEVQPVEEFFATALPALRESGWTA